MRDFPKWQKKDLFSYIGVGARDVETRSLHVIIHLQSVRTL